MSNRARSPRRGDYYARDRRDDRRDDRRRDNRRDDYRDDRDRDRRRDDRRDVRRPFQHPASNGQRPTHQQRDDRELFPRRDRSRDRRNDDRLPRYERSRERKRSRERSSVRDRRYRSRDRAYDSRDRRDDSRERKRPRRDDSVDSRRGAHREDTRDRRSSTASAQANEVRHEKLSMSRETELTRQAKKSVAEEMAKKHAERQAKLAAWKKKQEEKKAAEAAAQVVSATATQATDTPDAASPAAVASPQQSGQSAEKTQGKKLHQNHLLANSTQKPLQRRQRQSMHRAQLWALMLQYPGSLSLRFLLMAIRRLTPVRSLPQARSKVSLTLLSVEKPSLTGRFAGAPTFSGRPTNGITGFGLNQAQAESKPEQQSAMDAVDMGDEQVERKTLVKLPTPNSKTIPGMLCTLTKLRITTTVTLTQQMRVMKRRWPLLRAPLPRNVLLKQQILQLPMLR
ncbi:hypothetical protein H2203_003142 [Taxawa tesnikishii (nom. ined.)]|nr:hypothetical protein H2203_003142 [Dothideales sp. JES 119]